MIEKIVLMCVVASSVAVVARDPRAREQEQPPAQVVAAEPEPDGKHAYIGLGDRLELTDRFHPRELTTSAVVQDDGTAVFPELGAVQVAGLTASELEALLMEHYREHYDLLELEVRLVPRSKSFYLFGEVADEGRREFKGELSLWEAVMQNHPDLRSANLGRVRLIRPHPTDPWVISVDVARMNATGDSTYNLLVQEHDIVHVPAAPRSVAELLAEAAAGMDAFANGASPDEAAYVRKLIGAIEVISADFERVAR